MTKFFSSTTVPLLLPFDGVEPKFGPGLRFFGVASSVLGKVSIGARAIIAGGAVIRGDGHAVRIGDDFSIGEISTVHIAHKAYPAIIGHRVAVGRNAVVHACTVGDDCVIEDGAVILDGSVMADGVLVEQNATVFPRSKLEAGFVFSGSPATPIRELSFAERAERGKRLRQTAMSSRAIRDAATRSGIKLSERVFVAVTARLSGRIELEHQSSVFFGCHLDAGEAGITVGQNSNIQDNTQIRCASAGTVIGRDTTIGHNVLMHDCRIGDRALIGIGCVLAEGTAIEDDVLLAAGSTTTDGQKIDRGWLWGGRPARPLVPLDAAKRAMMQLIIEHYCGYARAYRRAQEHTA